MSEDQVSTKLNKIIKDLNLTNQIATNTRRQRSSSISVINIEDNKMPKGKTRESRSVETKKLDEKVGSITSFLNHEFKTNVKGTGPKEAAKILQTANENLDKTLIKEFASFCIMCSQTNRTFVDQKLASIIATNLILSKFLKDNCYINDKLNFSVVVCVGYLIIASKDGSEIKAHISSEILKDITEKMGSNNVFNSALTKMSTKRSEAVRSFITSFSKEEFDEAVTTVSELKC